MDEPLGALDKQAPRADAVRDQAASPELGFTIIYVTHDQTEALTMSDRIAVFNEGVVQQCAAPNVLYERPENAFVAEFIGENNLIPGKVVAVQGDMVRVVLAGGNEVLARRGDVTEADADCKVTVRPEKAFIATGDRPHDNTIHAKFTMRHYVGDFIRYYFELPDGSGMTVKSLNHASAPQFADGEIVSLGCSSTDCHAFKIT